MVGNLLISYLMQMLFTVGSVTLFGLLIYLTNRGIYRLSGNNQAVSYATGLIGTPIHECSHALMCLLFRHKITEISFYRISDDGVMGYVKHTYNPRNFYQQIGNFFIGTAPVILGSGVILLLFMCLANDSFTAMWSEISVAATSENTALSMLAAFGKMFPIVFAPSNFANGLWYLFFVLAICIALHLTLSPDDIKSAVPGLIFIAILLFAIDLVFMFIEGFTSATLLTDATSVIVEGGAFLSCFMMLSLTLSVALLAVLGVIYLIVRLVRR